MSLTYDQLTIGMRFPSGRFDVTDEVIARYRAATLDDVELPGDGGNTAPLMLAAVFTRAATNSIPGPRGRVLVKQSFHYHRPVVSGDQLTVDAYVEDLYQKRGRNYAVVRTSTRNQHGELIVEGLSTTIWPPSDGQTEN